MLCLWPGVSNTRPGRGRFVSPRVLFGNFEIFAIYVAKRLEKRCRNINEPKLNATQCGFHPGHSTTVQNITLQQIIEKSWEYAKNFYTYFVDLEKAYDRVEGFLVRSFGECCRSAVLTAACYWPSSHCIPAQKFVSVSGVLNRDRSPLVLDSDKGAWCHRFSS